MVTKTATTLHSEGYLHAIEPNSRGTVAVRVNYETESFRDFYHGGLPGMVRVPRPVFGTRLEMHTYIQAYIQAYIHACIYTYIRAYIHTYIHCSFKIVRHTFFTV